MNSTQNISFPSITSEFEDKKKFILNSLKTFVGKNDAQKTTAKVETVVDHHVGIIRFETLNSKTNLFSLDMVEKMIQALESFKNNQSVKVVVFSSTKPNSFFAGADLKLIESLHGQDAYEISKLFQLFISMLMNYDKPTACIIDGQCLGAGLEFALACNYRIVSEKSKAVFGFPEVLLNLIPGGLGTYLTFSKLDNKKGLEMLITGRSYDFSKALQLGLITHVNHAISGLGISASVHQKEFETLLLCKICSETDVLCRKDCAPEKSGSLFKLIMSGKWYDCCFLSNKIHNSLPYTYLTALSAKFRTLRHNYAGNRAQIDLINMFLEYRSNMGNSAFIDNYSDVEAKVFQSLVNSSEHKNAIHLTNSRSNLNAGLKLTAQPNLVKNIGVIGAAGLMGRGIVDVSLNRGKFDVMVSDNNDQAIQKMISEMSEESHQNSAAYKDATISDKLKFAKSYSDFGTADLIIEAVPEVMSLKQGIFKKIESYVRPDCILATNTSGLLVSEIAKVCNDPSRVIGMHYFSPVKKMQLLEIVLAKNTSEKALATALSVGKQQGKICVVVKDSPGFFTTRVITAMLLEVLDLYDDCYTPHTVDQELRLFGFPMDAGELIDDIGIVVCYKIIEYLSKELGENFNIYREGILEYLIKYECYGKKSMEGIYKYNYYGERSFLNIPSPNLHEYLRYRPGFVEPRPPIEEINPRVMLRILNESCKCIEEGVISSPSDGDIAAVYGIGFPNFLGGPFKHVDFLTPQVVVEQLDKYYEKRKIPAFKPCNLLLEMAESNKKFYN